MTSDSNVQERLALSNPILRCSRFPRLCGANKAHATALTPILPGQMKKAFILAGTLHSYLQARLQKETIGLVYNLLVGLFPSLFPCLYELKCVSVM